MERDDAFAREETEAAAAEAASIGGVAGDEDIDPADRPVQEAGGGVAEGFELAEADLIDHASHGDQQPAHTLLHRQGIDEEDPGSDFGEPDAERSSETESRDF
jgi:hypothetical protein